MYIYLVKVRFTGVFIFFLFLLSNIDSVAVLACIYDLCFEQK